GEVERPVGPRSVGRRSHDGPDRRRAVHRGRRLDDPADPLPGAVAQALCLTHGDATAHQNPWGPRSSTWSSTVPDTDIAQAMAHLQPGVQVSHFELLRPLGQGAMGVVYEARDLILDRSVAIKFIYLAGPHLQRPGVLAAATDRFQREAR